MQAIEERSKRPANRPLWIIQFIVASLAVSPAARALALESMPTAQSKKGLQVELVDDALALGVKHATFNVNLSQLVAPNRNVSASDPYMWRIGDQSFAMNESYVRSLDDRIKAFSSQGVIVYLIILAYESGDPQINRLLLHPQYDAHAPNHLGAFNSATAEGRAWLTACMSFMAHRWSAPNGTFGRVGGYIMGNEVNSHWWWSNMGKVTMEQFAAEYLQVMRLAYDAVQSQATWPRIYISLEHHWNIRYPAGDDRQCFAGRDFLDYFSQLARQSPGGDFEWHLAYHPYPENLFEPRFWNDKTATDQPNTPRITFKNLEMLTNYLARPELQYRGRTRRVILSEQGFHSLDGPEGELVQAAAYCYAYRKVAMLNGIDAFILHRHVDHPHEGGLRLGLRRNTPDAADPHPRKPIYDCFRAADTPDWKAAFDFALPIVGLKQWPE